MEMQAGNRDRARRDEERAWATLGVDGRDEAMTVVLFDGNERVCVCLSWIVLKAALSVSLL